VGKKKRWTNLIIQAGGPIVTKKRTQNVEWGEKSRGAVGVRASSFTSGKDCIEK